jgi:hypothetical protein
MSVQPAGGDDLYHLLGVAPDAEREVIDAAYRAMARKYHPDVNRAPDAPRRMQAINDAYAVLRDPAQRAAYDRTRPASFGSAGGGPSGAPETAAPPAAPAPPARRTGAPPRRAAGAASSPAGSSLRAAAAEVWRGWRTREARQSSRRFVAGAGAVLLLSLLALGAWTAWSAWQARTGAGTGGVDAYRRVAAAARAQVDAARRDYDAVRGGGGFAAAVAAPTFPASAARLAAELDDAAARLRAMNRIPPEVDDYHFRQLQDWQVERQLVDAYRDAALTRNLDLWTRTAEFEEAWRASPAHQQVEVLAKQLTATPPPAPPSTVLPASR